MLRREFLATGAAAVVLPLAKLTAFAAERRLLYIAVPGIRNYVEYGGVGVLVYDIGRGYTFVKRIPTWDVPEGQQPENVKGVAASARTGRLYVTTIKRTGCIDLLTEKMVWSKELEGGCDRLAISPDGQILYVPSLEGPHWNVVDAMSGDVITKVVTDSGAHNTVYSRRGDRVYLAGLRSPLLSIADTKTHKVVKTVGPFSAPIRPFTVNGAQTLCYVNVNGLLGFEIGDLTTGRKLHRVEVQGYEQGPVKRHGCPSHGIGLTPDERELWLCDGAQRRGARLRQHRHAPQADGHAPRPRSTRLGHLQHRRAARLPVHRRGVRDPHQENDRGARGRCPPADRQREAARSRLRGRQADPGTATSSAWG